MRTESLLQLDEICAWESAYEGGMQALMKKAHINALNMDLGTMWKEKQLYVDSLYGTLRFTVEHYPATIISVKVEAHMNEEGLSYGYCATYDQDSYGFGSCVSSAMRDFLKTNAL